MRNTRSKQNGNVVFIILVAVALFAALGFAVSQRGNVSLDREQAQIAAVEAEQCTLAINTGVKKLKRLNNCSASQISYELPDGSNENAQNTSNTSCFMFHPDGAGLTPCGSYLAGCADGVLATLAIGEACDNVVYAGMSGGNRIYTTLTDMGTITWNNDSTNWSITGASSASDGLANTNTLVGLSDVGAPYQAALACRGLGAQWYLPAKDELNLLYTNSTVGALNGTFNITDVYYYSSTEVTSSRVWGQRFMDGDQQNPFKGNNNRLVRCTRR